MVYFANYCSPILNSIYLHLVFREFQIMTYRAFVFRTLKLFTVFLSAHLISGCGATKLAYQVSPEIKSVEQISSNASLIYIAVVEKRAALPVLEKDQDFAEANGDDLKTLKDAIINRFTKEKMKIISDPLLADLALTFEVEQLNTKITSELFKAKLEATVHTRLKASRKGNNLEKVYKTKRDQEVAIPVNNNDVTGILNQALSAQLSKIFTDPQLIQLTKKSPVETTETFVIDPTE